jgi:hypothetical protein
MCCCIYCTVVYIFNCRYSDVSSLNNLQEQDFEQFEQQGK